MRLIDADALTKHLEEMADNEWNKSVGSSKGLEDAIDVVESMPTIKTFTLADIEEQYRKGMEKGLEEARPHGKWMKEIVVEEPRKNKRAYARCTECGVRFNHYKFAVLLFDFCPKCGARMKEGEVK